MSDGLSGFQSAWADALADAKRRADENDQRMLDALQGKPFWNRGLAVEVTGLAQWLPVDGRSYDAVGEQMDAQRAARCADPYDNVKPGMGRGDE